MKRNGSTGDIVTRTAPTGGVVSGVPLVIGSEFLIPLATVAAGGLVACAKRGDYPLPAKAEEVFTQGAPVYWHDDDFCEATDSANNRLIGTADGVVAADGWVGVCLNGGALPPVTGDLPAVLLKAGGTMTGAIRFVRASGACTAGAVALNGQSGIVTTQILDTPAGSTEMIVVTNSYVTSAAVPVLITPIPGTCSKGYGLVGCVSTAGQFSVTIMSYEETDALDGTIKFAYFVG